MPSSEGEIDVVVRCRNEMPYARRTLEALAAQTMHARVIFIDCHSNDGSREAAVAFGARIIDLDPAEYIPGRVLNLGMRQTGSAVVAFINADAVPLDPGALAALVAPLASSGLTAASYGRQLARPEADRLTRREYASAFPDGQAIAGRHGRFFSMAASALRRDAWETLPFDETLRYSEDADWVHRASALGYGIAYAPSARFVHSHDYDLKGQYRRQRGEGQADARIHHLGAPSAWRELGRPLARSLLRDAAAGIVSPRALGMRAAQALGYFAGRRAGSRA